MFFLMQILVKIKYIINKLKRGVTLAHKTKSKSFALKRISSFLLTIKYTRVKGSMTLEAALVLPFFLFAILNLISIIEIYRTQSNMSAALHLTAKQMAVYGYEYNEISESQSDNWVLTQLYVANNVKKQLGSDFFESSPVKNGFKGISWSDSEIMDDDECIDLVAEYKVEPAIAIVGFNDFEMYNRIRTRAWTGYDNSKSQNNAGDKEEIVYITPEGVAYHRSRGCTYLKLKISAADKELLKNKRSEDGSIYYPCEYCGNKSEGTVFVTNYGNRFHATLNCNKLKRTILAVPISEAGDRHSCSKCG